MFIQETIENLEAAIKANDRWIASLKSAIEEREHDLEKEKTKRAENQKHLDILKRVIEEED